MLKNPPLLGTKTSSFYARIHSLLNQLQLVNLFDPSYFLSYLYTNGPIWSTLSGDLMDIISS
jgi:hypothetical protein